jgi:hypothetical protein
MAAITLPPNMNGILGRTGLAIAGLLALTFAISTPGTKNTDAPTRNETRIDYPTFGQHGFVSLSKILACVRLDDMEHYERLVSEMDVPALNWFVRSRNFSGQCREIAKGAEVVVDQSPFPSDNLCVRLADEPDCLWTNARWIMRNRPELTASPRRTDNPG